jgi:transcriptional repressor NrdR
MVCPLCASPKTKVTNSRPTSEKGRVWRRRTCLSCRQVFTTYEAFDLSYIVVAKRRDISEQYQRMKLFVSLYKALEDASSAEHVLNTIERKLLRLQAHTMQARDIALLVAETIRSVSRPAYVRYLSYQPDRPVKK